jgi:hypothetical protein
MNGLSLLASSTKAREFLDAEELEGLRLYLTTLGGWLKEG